VRDVQLWEGMEILAAHIEKWFKVPFPHDEKMIDSVFYPDSTRKAGTSILEKLGSAIEAKGLAFAPLYESKVVEPLRAARRWYVDRRRGGDDEEQYWNLHLAIELAASKLHQWAASLGATGVATPKPTFPDYFPKDLCEALCIQDTATLNGYAKKLQIKTPSRGERGFRYQGEDARKLVAYIAEHGGDSTMRRNAKSLLEIRK
jgi:hypothetical protein